MNNSSKKDIDPKQPIRGYEILERIASGGMGAIYKARQLSMNRIVALKVLKKGELSDELPLDRLRREALIIARMDHPNIVKGIDMGETDRYYFFAMDFIEGVSVKERLDLHGAMIEAEAISIVHNVAKALHYAFNQKLIHRDIKPGNILLSDDGHTKLTDLGLAKGESDLAITKEGSVVGTPQYISPEQAKNPKAVDIRSDIYSLGATFYHMVTGRLPFQGATMAEMITKVLFSSPMLPEKIKPELNPGTSRVISRMMAKKSELRYQTPEDLLDDLDVLKEAVKDGSRELAGLVGMNWGESQQRRWLKPEYVLSAAALVLVFLIVLFFMQGNGKDAKIIKEPLTDEIIVLQEGYAEGEITPLDALKRAATLQTKTTEEQLNIVRNIVLSDCRSIIGDLLRTESPRFNRALADGGFDKAFFHFKKQVQRDIPGLIGGDYKKLPPDLKAFWNERLDEAKAYLLGLINQERESLFTDGVNKINSTESEIFGLIEARSLLKAKKTLNDFKLKKLDLMKEAETEFAKNIEKRSGRENVSRERFSDPIITARVITHADNVISKLEKRLVLTNELDIHAFINEVNQKTQELLKKADIKNIQEGPEAFIKAAMEEVKNRFPNINKDIDLDNLWLSQAVKSVRKSWVLRKDELEGLYKAQFALQLFSDIDERLQENDYTGAKEVINQAGEVSWTEEALVKQWDKTISDLANMEEAALKAIDSFNGLLVDFSTSGGIKYKGVVLEVDHKKKRFSIALEAGRPISLNLKDLKVEERISWCDKQMFIENRCKGLYAFYHEKYELAVTYFDEAKEFQAASHYLKRIDQYLNEAEVFKKAAGEELLDLLHSVEKSLAEGDWKKGLDLLETGKKKFHKLSGWIGSRRRRNDLKAKAIDLQKEEERRTRIASIFSIPVTLNQNGAIKVSWPFDSKNEIKDFTAHGPAWKIDNGKLVCGSLQMESNPDFYHNLIGVRFGNDFDTKKSISLSFKYEPPFEGPGPVFMGIRFYGACFGIRSYLDTPSAGQINYWNGDLDEYSDYFFIPSLGEDKPKKGRIRSFSFQKGERYNIGISWIPGKELLFSIDNKDLYRTRLDKLGENGIEIKTFRDAFIEEITIEGALKTD